MIPSFVNLNIIQFVTVTAAGLDEATAAGLDEAPCLLSAWMKQDVLLRHLVCCPLSLQTDEMAVKI